jgi:lariat debranching enzyme
MARFVNVAVEGCCHGELDKIYAAIGDNERRTGRKVDLLVVCGDFECVRDIIDLECLAVPVKYRKLNSFRHYITGEKVAPVLTIFVGGNHEASNVLQSLYYGGWVAPKIYFMGFAGVVYYQGLRIAGLSGIFNQKHYRTGKTLVTRTYFKHIRCNFVSPITSQATLKPLLIQKIHCVAFTICVSWRYIEWLI